MGRLSTAEELTEAKAQEFWYAIDPVWYDQRQVSLVYVARLRRCQDCREGRPPGGKAARKTAKSDSQEWMAEMSAIEVCCSQKAGYITPGTPMVEAVFRLLLKHGNRSLSTEELHQGVREAWIAGITPRDLSLAVLRWLLDHQDAYGLRRFERRLPEKT